MKRATLALLVMGLIVAPGIRAQDETPAKPKSKAKKAALIIPPKNATPPQEISEQEAGAMAEYAAIDQEFNKAQEAFFEAYRAAPKEKREEIIENRPQPAKWAKKMLDLAEKNPKTDAAAKALTWVCTHVPFDKTGLLAKARDILVRDHLESAAMARIARSLARSDDEKDAALLETLIAKNPHREVKAQATFALAKMLSKEDPKRAATLFEKCLTFDDVPLYGDMMIADKAKTELYEARNLAIGMKAPEIEGEDVDGVRFKLSDYRGKVVLLDFWGHW